MKFISISIVALLSLNILSMSAIGADNITNEIKNSNISKAFSYYKKGIEFYNLHTINDYKKAIVEFDKSLNIFPEYAEALAYKSLAQALLKYNLGFNDINQSKNKQDEAFDNAGKALTLNKSLTEGYIALSANHKFNGSELEAFENAQKALSLNQNNAETYFWLWFSSNNIAPNDPNIIKALNLNPNMLIAHYELGFAYLRYNKYNDALLEFQKTIRINPNFTNGYRGIGLVYVNREEYEKALSYFKKGLELEPGNVELIENIDNLFSKNKNILSKEEMAEILKNGLINNPESYSISKKFDQIIKKIDYKETIKIYKDIAEKGKSDKFYLLLGDKYLQKGNYKQAYEFYKKAEEIKPDLSFYKHKIIFIHYKQENYDKFFEYLNKINASEANNDNKEVWNKADTHKKLAKYFEDQGFEDEIVLEAYKKALKFGDKDPETYMNIGYLIGRVNKYDYGINILFEETPEFYFKKALLIDPENITYLEALASEYRNYQDDKAIKIYEKILEKNPNNIRTLINLSNIYFNNFDKALPYIQKIISIDKSNYDANIKMANYYLSKNDFEAALKNYNNILEKNNNYDVYQKIADIYKQQGKEKEYRDFIFKAKFVPLKERLKRWPQDSQAYYELGNLYKSENMFNEAILEYKEALKVNKVFTNANKALSSIYKLKSEKIKKESIINPLKKRYLSNSKSVNNIIALAEGYKKIGDYENTELFYNKALELNPYMKEIYSYLSDLYILKSELENKKALKNEQLKDYKYVLNNDPNNDNLYYEMALNLKEQGKINSAILGFEEAIFLDDKNPLYYYQLADAYRIAGREIDFKTTIKKACELGSLEACNLNKK